tara:strand:+ start:334 stop:2895 length:2562 start_codon:yes stop_codon:yes gene_type:complete
MNILRQQDILKGVPDQRLMQEMQSPSGSVPQFLVMSEMQRRKGMRDEFTSRQESPSTVAEDLVGVEKAQAGLGPQPLGVGQSPTTIQAGLPQPAQPVMMESGGVVKYQEGTEGLTVLSDDELIAMYRSIDPDGKLNGSSRDADEVLMEVEDRELDFSMQLDPSSGSVSLPNQRMTQEDRPPAPGFMQQILNKVSGKDPDNPFTGNLPPSSSGSVEIPRSLIRDNQPPNVEIPPVPNVQSDTIVQRLLERQGAPDTRRVLGRTEPNQDPVPLDNNKFAGIGKIFDTSSLINRRQEQEPPIEIGLPYSDEGLGGRDNLYRNLSDTYDRYNRRLSRNRVEEPTQVEGPPVPNVQSDTIIQRLLERQLPAGLSTSPKLPPDSKVSPYVPNDPQAEISPLAKDLRALQMENVRANEERKRRQVEQGENLSQTLDDITRFAGKGYDIAKSQLNRAKEYALGTSGGLNRANIDAANLLGGPDGDTYGQDLYTAYNESLPGPVSGTALASSEFGNGSFDTGEVGGAGGFNPFPGAVSPQEQASLNNIKLLSKTPTPVVAEAPPIRPAVVNPAVNPMLAGGPIGPEGTNLVPDLNAIDAGQFVQGGANKTTAAEKDASDLIKKDPAGAYEKMREQGISDAQAMGLIMAGLGIMEAASQPGATALGSLSGAKAGVQQYSKDLQALNERIEKRRLADETTRLKEAQLDISRMQASSAKTMAEVALKKFEKGKDPSAMVEMAIAIREAERIGDTQLAATLREVMKTLGSRDPVDKSIPNQATMARTEKAYVDGPQMSRDARALVDKNSKEWKKASSQQKLKLMDAAKSLAINNYMKERFGNAYRPSSSVSRKTPQASLASFNKKE